VILKKKKSKNISTALITKKSLGAVDP